MIKYEILFININYLIIKTKVIKKQLHVNLKKSSLILFLEKIFI